MDQSPIASLSHVSLSHCAVQPVPNITEVLTHTYKYCCFTFDDWLIILVQANIELLSDELKAPKYSSYFICKLLVLVTNTLILFLNRAHLQWAVTTTIV